MVSIEKALLGRGLLFRWSPNFDGGESGYREYRFCVSDSEDGDHDVPCFSQSLFIDFPDCTTGESRRFSLSDGGGGDGDKDGLLLRSLGFLRGLGDLYREPPGLL